MVKGGLKTEPAGGARCAPSKADCIGALPLVPRGKSHTPLIWFYA